MPQATDGKTEVQPEKQICPNPRGIPSSFLDGAFIFHWDCDLRDFPDKEVVEVIIIVTVVAIAAVKVAAPGLLMLHNIK